MPPAESAALQLPAVSLICCWSSCGCAVIAAATELQQSMYQQARLLQFRHCTCNDETAPHARPPDWFCQRHAAAQALLIGLDNFLVQQISALLLLLPNHAPAASATNVTAAPTAWWANANDDDYNIKAKWKHPIHRVLNVLANDEPKGSIKIHKIEASSNYGLLTMSDYGLSYDVERFDGVERNETFW
jgi:hypothetical protein